MTLAATWVGLKEKSLGTPVLDIERDLLLEVTASLFNELHELALHGLGST